jgi:diacylglycerol kinase family enzyme
MWVSTISALSRWRFVKMLFKTWMGRVAQDPYFHALTTKELRVESTRSRLYVSRDGEVELLKTPLLYTVHPRALRVIVP